VNETTRQFALLAFAREWLAAHSEPLTPAVRSHPPQWVALASHATIAEAHVWLDWGIELGAFPPDPPFAPAQQTMLADAVAQISDEPAYGFFNPLLAELLDDRNASAQRIDALDDRGHATGALHSHFQQLWRLAAAFARQRPASIMLATIRLEPQKGRFSFYETPSAVGTLTGDHVGAVLAANDQYDERTPGHVHPATAGAVGVAGLLQTLEHLASVQRVFDALGRSVDRQASGLASSDGSDRTPAVALSAEDVHRFERRFAACQGWRINLLDPTVKRRFVVLRDFAADLIREELTIDHGRLTRRMLDDRTAANTVFVDADDIEYLERFDPRVAVDEWRQETDTLIDDWIRRLGAAQHRGTPPALATARA